MKQTFQKQRNKMCCRYHCRNRSSSPRLRLLFDPMNRPLCPQEGAQKKLPDEQKNERPLTTQAVSESCPKDTPVLPERSHGEENEYLTEGLNRLQLVRADDTCLPLGSPLLKRQNGTCPP